MELRNASSSGIGDESTASEPPVAREREAPVRDAKSPNGEIAPAQTARHTDTSREVGSSANRSDFLPYERPTQLQARPNQATVLIAQAIKVEGEDRKPFIKAEGTITLRHLSILSEYHILQAMLMTFSAQSS